MIEIFCRINKIHRNNMHKATAVNTTSREKTLTLERFLREEDRWKMFLVVGPEKHDGMTGTSCCSLVEKNGSAKISEGINKDDYTSE